MIKGCQFLISLHKPFDIPFEFRPVGKIAIPIHFAYIAKPRRGVERDRALAAIGILHDGADFQREDDGLAVKHFPGQPMSVVAPFPHQPGPAAPVPVGGMGRRFIMAEMDGPDFLVHRQCADLLPTRAHVEIALPEIGAPHDVGDRHVDRLRGFIMETLVIAMEERSQHLAHVVLADGEVVEGQMLDDMVADIEIQRQRRLLDGEIVLMADDAGGGQDREVIGQRKIDVVPSDEEGEGPCLHGPDREAEIPPPAIAVLHGKGLRQRHGHDFVKKPQVPPVVDGAAMPVEYGAVFPHLPFMGFGYHRAADGQPWIGGIAKDGNGAAQGFRKEAGVVIHEEGMSDILVLHDFEQAPRKAARATIIRVLDDPAFGKTDVVGLPAIVDHQQAEMVAQVGIAIKIGLKPVGCALNRRIPLEGGDDARQVDGVAFRARHDIIERLDRQIFDGDEAGIDQSIERNVRQFDDLCRPVCVQDHVNQIFPTLVMPGEHHLQDAFPLSLEMEFDAILRLEIEKPCREDIIIAIEPYFRSLQGIEMAALAIVTRMAIAMEKQIRL